ncbi:MAG: hypothetical protein EAZ43_04415 [Betaproteobacteria bacterium]|nr:MAG: hypothetical protein EAZ43_04415 [Betaproteobacteria bacterium]
MGIALPALMVTAQLSGTAHAGFTAATLQVNLTVTTAPPAAPATVNGSFTYGVSCVGVIVPQAVLTFPPPAITIATNTATPISTNGTVSTGSQVIGSNDCTFTQLTRPAAPAGYLWNGAPPDVLISNISLDDPPPVYEASFANQLTLPAVTGLANPPAGGSVSCTLMTTLGVNSTCTATANPNYVFSGFITSGCGGPSGSSPYITSSPILDNCTVTGSFSPLYTVTANVTTAGGTANCTSPIAAGITSTCTATASTGYTFAGFTPANINCGSASTANPYVTAPLSANCVVNVAFAPIAVPTSPAAAIPTMSGWVLMLLGVAMLLGGAFRVGQVRRVT